MHRRRRERTIPILGRIWHAGTICRIVPPGALVNVVVLMTGHELQIWLTAAALLGLAPAARGRTAFADDRQTVAPRAQSVPDQAQIERLIDRLSDDRRRVRVEAEQTLRGLGPAILSRLPAPENVASRAARSVLEQLRREFTETLARQRLQPTRLTVHGEFALAELLEHIAHETGNPFDLSALADADRHRRIAVNFQNTPFWTAMLTIRREARVSWKGVAGASVLAIVPAGEPLVPAVDCGVGCVFVTSCRLDPFFGDPSQQRLRCGMRLFVEPRLRALFLKYTGQSWQVVPGGDHIDVAPLLTREASVEVPMGQGGVTVDWHIDYRTTAAMAAQGLALTGQIELEVAAAEEAFRFGDLEQVQESSKRRGGVTVTLARVQRTSRGTEPSGVRVEMSVVYDRGGPAFESHRTWILHNRAWLESAAGERAFVDGGMDLTRQINGGVAVEYQFQELPEFAESLDAVQFVYETPTVIDTVPLAFSFDELIPDRPDARP